MSETKTSSPDNSKKTIVIVIVVLVLLACCAFLCLGIAGWLGITVYNNAAIDTQIQPDILPSLVDQPDENDNAEQPSQTPTTIDPVLSTYEKLLGDWRSYTIYKSLELGYESSMQAYMARLVIRGGSFGNEEIVGPWKVTSDPTELNYPYEIYNDAIPGMYYLEIVGVDQTYVFVVHNVADSELELEEPCTQRPCTVQPFVMTKY